LDFIPIIFSKPRIILIDDDKLIRFNWNKYCSQNEHCEFFSYSSIIDFENNISNHINTDWIFIDSSLGNGIQGELEAEKLFDKGFLNLYLTTSYDRQDFKNFPWIKNVVSKDPIVLRNMSL